MRNLKPREDWEIREDARVLARAEEIKADKERLKDATLMAKEIAREEYNKMAGLMKVAGRKIPKEKGVANSIGAPFSKTSYKNPATIGKL